MRRTATARVREGPAVRGGVRLGFAPCEGVAGQHRAPRRRSPDVLCRPEAAACGHADRGSLPASPLSKHVRARNSVVGYDCQRCTAVPSGEAGVPADRWLIRILNPSPSAIRRQTFLAGPADCHPCAVARHAAALRRPNVLSPCGGRTGGRVGGRTAQVPAFSAAGLGEPVTALRSLDFEFVYDILSRTAAEIRAPSDQKGR